MEPAHDDVLRPAPHTAVIDRIAARVRWFGLGRLVAAAASIAVVALGAAWLVESPEPPIEASLPVASAVATPPLGTSVAPLSSPPAPPEVVVHVAGAVVSPGVLRLPAGARVVDAVAAAGGALPEAMVDSINLAAPLVDGLRLYVPRVGEEVVAQAAPASGPDDTRPGGPVDLNRATAAELDALPGIGPSTAAAIVEHRERAGPFASVDDLDEVTGIGPAKLAALVGLVTV